MSQHNASNCLGCGRYSWVGDSGLCYDCERATRGISIKVSGDQHFENCRVCGNSLRDKRADAQFCSDGCRQRYHRAMDAGHDKWCGNCGESFKAKRSDAVACSSKCRQALYRLRKVKASPVVSLGYEIPVIRVDEE